MKNLNLTPRAQKLIKEALKICVQNKNASITNLHIFAAFLTIKHNQIEDAFLNFNYDIEKLKNLTLEYIKNTYSIVKKTNHKPVLSDNSKLVFKCAKQISVKYDHKYIGLEHIFISLFEIKSDIFINFLETIKNEFNLEDVIQYFEYKLEEDEISSLNDESPKMNDVPPNKSNSFDTKKYKTLNTYAANLNLQVASGKINNLHINKSLIQKISEILCRKNKNNPLIIGEAGVGKTALVECLASSIVNCKCSDLLALKQIYSLDVSMMIAGCKYRGEFEEKIKNLLKEIVDDPYVILFIDEIHTIIGAGNPENGYDVANILKPYLARGEISCIGATTFDEYKKTIADDPALNRRFQIIKIEEPNKEETLNLIKNIKDSYESYHVVNFSDDILKYIIEVSDKYIEGRFPDKALDIIDQVGAKAKLKNFIRTPKMLKMEAKIGKLADKQKNSSNALQAPEVQKLFIEYEKVVQKMVDKWKTNKYKITQDDILEVVADKTNIPINELKKQDLDKIKKLKDSLFSEILGQSEPIEQIYKCLIRAKAGFRNINKPISSLLFAGPTGVGKTMAAKIIADNLFLNKNNYIFIDMSEYTDKTAVNKLIGSNPGYIGFEKGGVLTEKIRKNPYSLILFDEIQKADPDVLFLLLQILEEGKISDSIGKVIDFSNTIIVMTTNIGAQAVTNSTIGFNTKTTNNKTDILSAVKKYFPADFLNRLDEVIAFNALQDKEIKDIIEKEITKLKNELNEKNIVLNYDNDLINFVFSKIQFDNFGARQVMKTIQRELHTLIAEKILENNKLETLKISIKDNNICVT